MMRFNDRRRQLHTEQALTIMTPKALPWEPPSSPLQLLCCGLMDLPPTTAAPFTAASLPPVAVAGAGAGLAGSAIPNKVVSCWLTAKGSALRLI